MVTHTHKRSLKNKSSSLYLILALATAAMTNNVSASEPYVNLGLNTYNVIYDTFNAEVDASKEQGTSLLLGFGIRNQYGTSQKHYFGFGVEAQEVLGDKLIGLRALDYQYQLSQSVRLGAYFGAITLNSGAAQTGYYTGANLSMLTPLENVDMGIDIRITDKLQRDRFFDDDPQDPENRRPDIFLRITSVSFFVTKRF